jgi:hypothetical protein
MRVLWTLAVLLMLAAPAWAAPHWEVDLTWQAPAPATPPKPAPTGYHVQARPPAGTWTTLTATPLPATALAYTAVGPYQDGQAVCFRVMAQPQNPDGSNAGVEVCSTAPVQYPGQVTAPSVLWRWVPQ